MWTPPNEQNACGREGTYYYYYEYIFEENKVMQFETF